ATTPYYATPRHGRDASSLFGGASPCYADGPARGGVVSAVIMMRRTASLVRLGRWPGGIRARLPTRGTRKGRSGPARVSSFRKASMATGLDVARSGRIPTGWAGGRASMKASPGVRTQGPREPRTLVRRVWNVRDPGADRNTKP